MGSNVIGAIDKEINIGQLVREKWGKENTFNIGFTTYTGTIISTVSTEYRDEC